MNCNEYISETFVYLRSSPSCVGLNITFGLLPLELLRDNPARHRRECFQLIQNICVYVVPFRLSSQRQDSTQYRDYMNTVLFPTHTKLYSTSKSQAKTKSAQNKLISRVCKH